jgi:hypothetical protein
MGQKYYVGRVKNIFSGRKKKVLTSSTLWLNIGKLWARNIIY